MARRLKTSLILSFTIGILVTSFISACKNTKSFAESKNKTYGTIIVTIEKRNIADSLAIDSLKRINTNQLLDIIALKRQIYNNYFNINYNMKKATAKPASTKKVVAPQQAVPMMKKGGMVKKGK